MNKILSPEEGETPSGVTTILLEKTEVAVPHGEGAVLTFTNGDTIVRSHGVITKGHYPVNGFKQNEIAFYPDGGFVIMYPESAVGQEVGLKDLRHSIRTGLHNIHVRGFHYHMDKESFHKDFPDFADLWVFPEVE